MAWVKPGFHYPSSRPVHGWVDGPWTRVYFLTPELTARLDGCQKMHPSSWAINSTRKLGPSTRVVETGLNNNNNNNKNITNNNNNNNNIDINIKT